MVKAQDDDYLTLSKVKSNQLKAMLSKAEKKSEIFLIYGSSGCGKVASVRKILRSFNLTFGEFVCDSLSPSIDSLHDFLISRKGDSFIIRIDVHSLLGAIHICSEIVDMWIRVNLCKKVFLILSAEDLPQAFHDFKNNITTLHVPRPTEAAIRKILANQLRDTGLDPACTRLNNLLSLITKKSKGDICAAKHELQWHLCDQEKSKSLPEENMGKDVSFHAKHVAMKILSRKAEYSQVTKYDFLQPHGARGYIDIISDQIPSYFSSADTHKLSSTLYALSFSEVWSNHRLKNENFLEILYFSASYIRNGPIPESKICNKGHNQTDFHGPSLLKRANPLYIENLHVHRSLSVNQIYQVNFPVKCERNSKAYQANLPYRGLSLDDDEIE